jgi:hypothetical protein
MTTLEAEQLNGTPGRFDKLLRPEVRKADEVLRKLAPEAARKADEISITRTIFRPAAAHLAFRRSTKETNPPPQASSTCLECRRTPGS